MLDEIIDRDVDVKGLIVVLTDLFHKMMPSEKSDDMGEILNILKTRFLSDD